MTHDNNVNYKPNYQKSNIEKPCPLIFMKMIVNSNYYTTHGSES